MNPPTRNLASRNGRANNPNLERSKVAFFPTNWTLVHPITGGSPLYGCTAQQNQEFDAEFLILLRAMDDTFAQLVQTWYSYRYDEVIWGRNFGPCSTAVSGASLRSTLKRWTIPIKPH